MNLEDCEKIYFIGIGGIGMSAAAGLAKRAGFEVSGSDQAEVYNPAAKILADHDIPYFRGYAAEHIDGAHADAYIVSSGEDLTNPEMARLQEKNLAYFSFSELAEALAADNIRIVVAGTHGKSTTAGLLGHMLRQIDDSSFLVGAALKNYDSNFHSGDGNYFVFEGDEYRATFDDPTPKFHYYKPDVLVLTNLEFDHPDMFDNLDEIKTEFAQLLESMPGDGILVYNADDSALNDLAYNSTIRSFSYATDNPGDITLTRAEYFPDRVELELLNNIRKHGGVTERYSLRLRGAINVKNALAAITALRALGFEPELVGAHIKNYSGVRRRFEVVGEHGGVTIVDDYAHHPTAVAQTLEAARLHFPDRRMWAVFEPHTFSRTKATLTELAGSFSAADKVLIADIYPARENARTAGIRSAEVIAAVQQQYPGARAVSSKSAALKLLRDESRPGDIIIVMAVGNFYRLGYELLDALREGKT